MDTALILAYASITIGHIWWTRSQLKKMVITPDDIDEMNLFWSQMQRLSEGKSELTMSEDGLEFEFKAKEEEEQ